jgi:hypothetical protein
MEKKTQLILTMDHLHFSHQPGQRPSAALSLGAVEQQLQEQQWPTAMLGTAISQPQLLSCSRFM